MQQDGWTDRWMAGWVHEWMDVVIGVFAVADDDDHDGDNNNNDDKQASKWMMMTPIRLWHVLIVCVVIAKPSVSDQAICNTLPPAYFRAGQGIIHYAISKRPSLQKTAFL